MISGTVTLAGPIPPPRQILVPNCHAGADATVPDETVVAGSDGALRNVIVHLKDGPNVATSSGPLVLDQVGCRYVPHVVTLRTGQTLRVRSSDPTLHNVHGLPDRNRPFNFGMTMAGETRDMTFTHPEIFRIRCDVHPWMQAYAGVFDHPFHAVTGEDGTFRLEGVPAGTYTLVAWHEKYGQRQQTVTVGESGQINASFTFGN